MENELRVLRQGSRTTCTYKWVSGRGFQYLKDAANGVLYTEKFSTLEEAQDFARNILASNPRYSFYIMDGDLVTEHIWDKAYAAERKRRFKFIYIAQAVTVAGMVSCLAQCTLGFTSVAGGCCLFFGFIFFRLFLFCSTGFNNIESSVLARILYILFFNATAALHAVMMKPHKKQRHSLNASGEHHNH